MRHGEGGGFSRWRRSAAGTGAGPPPGVPAGPADVEGEDDSFVAPLTVPEGTVLTELRLDEEVIGTISSKVAERYVR